MVDGNSNALSELPVPNPSQLDLGGGRTLATPLTGVVLGRARPNDGAQQLGGPREALPSLAAAVLESSLLATGLVEPGPDADSLPVLPEVHVGEDVVMSDHAMLYLWIF